VAVVADACISDSDLIARTDEQVGEKDSLLFTLELGLIDFFACRTNRSQQSVTAGHPRPRQYGTRAQ
jgi:hypothetical protein